jgi:hypothetical protein
MPLQKGQVVVRDLAFFWMKRIADGKHREQFAPKKSRGKSAMRSVL